MTETNIPPATTKRLLRSRTDRKLTGVCGGLAEYFDIDANLIRVGVVLTTLFTGGAVAVGYLIAAILIPES
jgi:phage shock protein PspC (stress-responsive transcriptional regulator)